jgi:hypothetical protein
MLIESGAADVMGIIEPSTSERVLLLVPREYTGTDERKLVARTSVEIAFDDEANLQKCVEALRESDEELAKRPDALKMWDWSKTFRVGMTIQFGVNWYDIEFEFFNQRKDAFKTPKHVAIYEKFGAKPEQFNVVHEVLVEQK